MWTTEYTAETSLPPAIVWDALRDLHCGQLAYEGSDRFELHGPFEIGTEISVTPVGQDTFRSRIVELVDGERYADFIDMGDVALLFRHTLESHGNGTLVTHRLEISGPASEAVGPELGPQISGDFPEAMAGLLSAAALRERA